jgi:hypothetical protein
MEPEIEAFPPNVTLCRTSKEKTAWQGFPEEGKEGGQWLSLVEVATSLLNVLYLQPKQLPLII